LRQNLALRDSLRPIAAARQTTVAAVAIAWVLALPAVTGAIVGARTREQVTGWTGAPEVELSEDDQDAMRPQW
jgi:aryl-alcohol dehydrogenase-like predicted oxidoreductase